ncbi:MULTISPECIES: co-chaperone DjlA [Marinobacter]|uniref:Co-chaperone protein DjlA n=1 Tax=Marinobacter profundi TaxID=2666256 RepID=A0A2G1UGP1_9GAMM|nr:MULTISPECIES: co-chaperone DjlA [Marinobacter]MBD3655910.1 co-chaperone DjlA [Marinobacter sp.]PHQ13599.1 co-chaperone DjlA [Marinobacter profundi]
MSFAMIIGALIGYQMGKFPGLLIGAFAGYMIARALKKKVRQSIGKLQSGFTEPMFAVMGALCKADGVVTQDEIRMAETLFDRFRLTGVQREQAKNAFNRGKAADFDLDAELAAFLRISRNQPALLQLFLQVQVSAVAADGKVHPAEHEMLVRIARRLGLPEAQVDQLEAMLGGRQAGGAGPGARADNLSQAYRVLGVAPEVSDSELKRAYRKLMSENHPDKLAGRGLPESMREMAEERTREISHAYDVIKEARKRAG